MKALTMAATVLAISLAGGTAFGQANPCGPKKPANPCNPCGGKAQKEIPVNPCHAKAGTVFHAADPMGRNTAAFTSRAPLEDIVGTTNQVSGYVVFDPKRPSATGLGLLAVPVASLKTGIPLRDEHLSGSDWLDAARFPDITFAIEQTRNVREAKRSDEFQTYDLTLVGTLSIHGRSERVEAPARVTYMRESDRTRQKMPGNLLAGRTEFEISLADFGIAGPAGKGLVGSKVGETVAIQVSFVASDKKALAGNPCNPCGPQNPCNPCGPQNPCNPCGKKKAGRS